MKTILIWVGILVLVIGSVAGLYYLSSRGPSEPEIQLSKGVSPGDQKLGPENAKAILVEYGDYQCAACAFYSPWIDQLMLDMNDSVLFVYRHYPLNAIHKHADLAARVAEAAGKQGKFWEMHKRLYDGQKDWEKLSSAKDVFWGYAGELALDMSKFEADVNSSEVKNKVAEDLQSGNLSGVRGTPTFYLNGKGMGYPQTYEEFKSIVQSAAR